MKKSGEKHVLLITEHLNLEELHGKFPTITKKLLENNIIIGKNPIPVTPAAHYMVGGIAVNNHGQAKYKGQKIENLFAIGEVACTGLHGANRLASNSLLEAVVYADRAANNIIQNIDLNDNNIKENLDLIKCFNPVVMAGGIGSRFWPMSRETQPKQFLDILGTGRSLIQMTYDRLSRIVPNENIVVVTQERYRGLVHEHLGQLPAENVLCEPFMRNTAPCIAYANHWVANKAGDQASEAVMIVAP